MGTRAKSGRRMAFRILLVALILAVGFEFSLWTAHCMAERRQGELAHPGAPVVLCLGDSHTFGVKVSAAESYPGRLQEMFDERGLTVNVVNEGVPGQNSSELRRALPGLLDEYRPEVVIVMIGANNEWNLDDTLWSDLRDGAADTSIGHWPRIAWCEVAGRLRTARLLAYLYNEHLRETLPNEREVDRDGRVHFHEWRGKGRFEPPAKVIDRTRRDLAAIIRMISDNGGLPAVMTYPGKPDSPMGGANALLREAARTRGALLADLDRAVDAAITGPRGEPDEEAIDRLFLSEPGETHLDAPGYALAAAAVMDALMKRGFPENTPPGEEPPEGPR